MPYREPEDGEPMSFYQEEYESGRLAWQKQQALDAKAVRQFLVKNPGANRWTLAKATGIQNVPATLNWLCRKGFVKMTFRGPEVVPL